MTFFNINLINSFSSLTRKSDFDFFQTNNFTTPIDENLQLYCMMC